MSFFPDSLLIIIKDYIKPEYVYQLMNCDTREVIGTSLSYEVVFNMVEVMVFDSLKRQFKYEHEFKYKHEFIEESLIKLTKKTFDSKIVYKIENLFSVDSKEYLSIEGTLYIGKTYSGARLFRHYDLLYRITKTNLDYKKS